MAFVYIGSTTTIKVNGQTSVTKVIEVTAKSVPSGVVFVYDFPYESWVGLGGLGGLDAVVGPISDDIENIVSQPEVAGAFYAQDTNAAGLLVGYLEVVVQVPSRDTTSGGMLTETVDVDIESLGNPEFAAFTWQAQVAAAKGRLQALAAAG